MALNVMAYGATGNGTTDDTAAIQACLNAVAASATESVAYMPQGVYLISSASLVIPRGVTLEGPGVSLGTQWNVASNNWVHGETASLAITFNPSSKTEDDAAIRMNSGSKLKGFGIYYPNQPVSGSAPTVAYPPTVGLVTDPRGHLGNVSRPMIENLFVANAFVFVSWTKRHDLGTIVDVYGTAINTFIKLDQAYDVDRIIRVHSNPNAAYAGTWAASPHVLDRQHAQTDGQFIRLAKADQAYLFNTFGFGYRRGLCCADDGYGGPNGLQVMECGFEGTPNPMTIHSGNSLIFAQIVLGDSADLPGYGTGAAIIISPPNGQTVTGVSFSQMKIFSSTGPAIEAYRTKGLFVVNSLIERVRTAGGFLRGAIETRDVSQLTLNDNRVSVAGANVIMAILDNTRGFNIRDNYYGGQAAGGTSPIAVTNSQAGRITGNLQDAGSGAAAAPWISGSTDVTAENFRTFTN